LSNKSEWNQSKKIALAGRTEASLPFRERGGEMNNLKLKIWDKEQKKFLEINWENEETRFNKGKACIRYSEENGLYVTLSGYTDEDGWPYQVDADILRYTGLKDKNKKEICEGDKVRCYGGEYCQGFWEHSEIVTVKDITKDCFGLREYEHLEVIGNIYENEVAK
jgi:hypothetical protein